VFIEPELVSLFAVVHHRSPRQTNAALERLFLRSLLKAEIALYSG
jgi:hypothetical protein